MAVKFTLDVRTTLYYEITYVRIINYEHAADFLRTLIGLTVFFVIRHTNDQYCTSYFVFCNSMQRWDMETWSNHYTLYITVTINSNRSLHVLVSLWDVLLYLVNDWIMHTVSKLTDILKLWSAHLKAWFSSSTHLTERKYSVAKLQPFILNRTPFVIKPCYPRIMYVNESNTTDHPWQCSCYNKVLFTCRMCSTESEITTLQTEASMF